MHRWFGELLASAKFLPHPQRCQTPQTKNIQKRVGNSTLDDKFQKLQAQWEEDEGAARDMMEPDESAALQAQQQQQQQPTGLMGSIGNFNGGGFTSLGFFNGTNMLGQSQATNFTSTGDKEDNWITRMRRKSLCATDAVQQLQLRQQLLEQDQQQLQQQQSHQQQYQQQQQKTQVSRRQTRAVTPVGNNNDRKKTVSRWK
ncbi:MAG: hypothetical protein EZS28_047236 [Streblomastix strix]|uniref:Uncharacterized protein n=1 Tax=Streblomastix strix TaxID=222440 RepID=A0A5J4TG58_9EUKA|nr:MAG: hypothetical protein EZS28_047236 [Streblomastix strix]